MTITALTVPSVQWRLTIRGGEDRGFEVLAFAAGDDKKLHFFVKEPHGKTPFETRLISEDQIATLSPHK